MADIADLKTGLQELSQQWTQLTSIPESPRSTMQVIEYSLGGHRRAEEYANRLLRYFLHRNRPHGMGDEFLRAFLWAEDHRQIDELSDILASEDIGIDSLISILDLSAQTEV